MTRRIGLLSALATVAGLTLAPAPNGAAAATTIGSKLAGSPTIGLSCTPPSCTVAQSILPAASQAPGGVLAPQNGVVVRWRIKTGAITSAVALRITRPGNSDTRTGAGTGSTVTPATDQTSTFDVRLPIQAGDALGLDCCIGPASGPFAANPAAVTLLWEPSLQDGAASRMGSEFPLDSELLINADIEADSDCDGLGDETQDGQITACPVNPPATGQRAAALKKCKKKAKKNHWTKKRLRKCKKKAKSFPSSA